MTNEAIETYRERQRRKVAEHRHSHAIGIRCTAEELPAKLAELAARGFEQTDDLHYETADSKGVEQHLVVTYIDPTGEKGRELASLPNIHTETRCF